MSLLEQEIESARKRFIAWLRWYMAMYPELAPTKQALADKLGVTRSAVSQLLDEKGRRRPDFGTLVAAKRLLGFPFDALLGSDPPAPPGR